MSQEICAASSATEQSANRSSDTRVCAVLTKSEFASPFGPLKERLRQARRTSSGSAPSEPLQHHPNSETSPSPPTASVRPSHRQRAARFCRPATGCEASSARQSVFEQGLQVQRLRQASIEVRGTPARIPKGQLDGAARPSTAATGIRRPAHSAANAAPTSRPGDFHEDSGEQSSNHASGGDQFIASSDAADGMRYFKRCSSVVRAPVSRETRNTVDDRRISLRASSHQARRRRERQRTTQTAELRQMRSHALRCQMQSSKASADATSLPAPPAANPPSSKSSGAALRVRGRLAPTAKNALDRPRSAVCCPRISAPPPTTTMLPRGGTSQEALDGESEGARSKKHGKKTLEASQPRNSSELLEAAVSACVTVTPAGHASQETTTLNSNKNSSHATREARPRLEVKRVDDATRKQPHAGLPITTRATAPEEMKAAACRVMARWLARIRRRMRLEFGKEFISFYHSRKLDLLRQRQQQLLLQEATVDPCQRLRQILNSYSKVVPPVSKPAEVHCDAEVPTRSDERTVTTSGGSSRPDETAPQTSRPLANVRGAARRDAAPASRRASSGASKESPLRAIIPPFQAIPTPECTSASRQEVRSRPGSSWRERLGTEATANDGVSHCAIAWGYTAANAEPTRQRRMRMQAALDLVSSSLVTVCGLDARLRVPQTRSAVSSSAGAPESPASVSTEKTRAGGVFPSSPPSKLDIEVSLATVGHGTVATREHADEPKAPTSRDPFSPNRSPGGHSTGDPFPLDEPAGSFGPSDPPVSDPSRDSSAERLPHSEAPTDCIKSQPVLTQKVCRSGRKPNETVATSSRDSAETAGHETSDDSTTHFASDSSAGAPCPRPVPTGDSESPLDAEGSTADEGGQKNLRHHQDTAVVAGAAGPWQTFVVHDESDVSCSPKETSGRLFQKSTLDNASPSEDTKQMFRMPPPACSFTSRQVDPENETGSSILSSSGAQSEHAVELAHLATQVETAGTSVPGTGSSGARSLSHQTSDDDFPLQQSLPVTSLPTVTTGHARNGRFTKMQDARVAGSGAAKDAQSVLCLAGTLQRDDEARFEPSLLPPQIRLPPFSSTRVPERSCEARDTLEVVARDRPVDATGHKPMTTFLAALEDKLFCTKALARPCSTDAPLLAGGLRSRCGSPLASGHREVALPDTKQPSTNACGEALKFSRYAASATCAADEDATTAATAPVAPPHLQEKGGDTEVSFVPEPFSRATSVSACRMEESSACSSQVLCSLSRLQNLGHVPVTTAAQADDVLRAITILRLYSAPKAIHAGTLQQTADGRRTASLEAGLENSSTGDASVQELASTTAKHPTPPPGPFMRGAPPPHASTAPPLQMMMQACTCQRHEPADLPLLVQTGADGRPDEPPTHDAFPAYVTQHGYANRPSLGGIRGAGTVTADRYCGSDLTQITCSEQATVPEPPAIRKLLVASTLQVFQGIADQRSKQVPLRAPAQTRRHSGWRICVPAPTDSGHFPGMEKVPPASRLPVLGGATANEGLSCDGYPTLFNPWVGNGPSVSCFDLIQKRQGAQVQGSEETPHDAGGRQRRFLHEAQFHSLREHALPPESCRFPFASRAEEPRLPGSRIPARATHPCLSREKSVIDLDGKHERLQNAISVSPTHEARGIPAGQQRSAVRKSSAGNPQRPKALISGRVAKGGVKAFAAQMQARAEYRRRRLELVKLR
ncbi:hypothetical protein BESB_039910 [Besnoitia besnoiti]|uniref:Uncharacterized protein n=1 Tax=Besnoitia besnoiti TaxID=94643 RepID=A0A2A9MNM1_BESBE|nr:hypothetical protein BESB_039910 [Besnoitia besnoiti]PFH37533.1 hypothetical protein BESB_039910 [Besnoitia besnoiti]